MERESQNAGNIHLYKIPFSTVPKTTRHCLVELPRKQLQGVGSAL